ncbi:imelysin family protein [Nitrogeniibacter aestuarii]|uniref:imelysin family protein n=1 Tax=Nitrogeniibacter aestuarii TaxID=2815343 RepID=UPI001D0F4BF5|nr:imelysin family protein [Nitrogeniibacter aestuarii]
MKRILAGAITALLSTVTLAAPSSQAVMTHYADLAQAVYGDALSTARQLQRSVNELIAHPDDKTLAAARAAWVAARHPYQQTEAYRFGNAIVDDWEGKVNAWPLDEGLIDYVDASYGDESDENPYYTVNIIAHEKLELSGRTIDASKIDEDLIAQLHEVDEIEANVTTGYHAIEFLLWGQDLNGNGPGAGQRPATDFDPAHCTGGHCARRAQYLKAATDLLVKELEWMSAQWAPDGEARQAVIEAPEGQGLGTILGGMGSLSYGELAGERMKLGLMLHDPEEEHDCFSDNTHYSHYNDALGIRNVYTGTYVKVDGSKMSGPSLADLVAAKDPKVDAALRQRLDETVARMQALVDSAKAGEAYDQMIGEGNAEGNARVQAAIDALLAQTRAIEGAVTALGLEHIAFEGSDSLDAPEKVGQ